MSTTHMSTLGLVCCVLAGGCDGVLMPDFDNCPGGLSKQQCTAFFNPTTDGGADAGCKSNAMCTMASASKCDSGECVACVGDSDCSHIDGKPRCSNGACEVCTTATESEDCDGNSCHPETKTCTDTALNSVITCRSCVSDSECLSDSTTERRCVMTQFGTPLADHRSFCLVKKPDAESCLRPTAVPLEATSENDELGTYCFPIQSLTTCEAINNFPGTSCTNAISCGATEIDDGLCKDDGGGGKCTYKCGGDDNNCKEGFSCFDDGTDEYCCTLGTTCS